MTNEEFNSDINKHLKEIEISLKKIKDLSHVEGHNNLIVKVLDAEQCMSELYKEIDR